MKTSTSLRMIVGFAAALGTGCAGRPDPTAYDNRVFYDLDRGAVRNLGAALERPFPQLDRESVAGRPHLGVEVLEGLARLSRPKDWAIRSGSVVPDKRFIEYVSPRQTLVSVYERPESPEETWSTVISRYLAETKLQGGNVQGEAVPVALGNAQARAFDVLRAVPAGKDPLVAFSREYLARSAHRIVLIQVVRPREGWEPVEAELLHTLQTLELL